MTLQNPLQEILVTATDYSIKFLIGSILISLILKKAGNNWKIRPWIRRVLGSSGNPNPFISSVKAVFIAIPILLFGPPIIDILLGPRIRGFLECTAWDIIPIFLLSGSILVFYVSTAILRYRNVPIIRFSLLVALISGLYLFFF